ncbi:flagellar basal body-associated protein FliL [Salinicola salarius]|uniref:flagellar basal body-associated protein FliL n=1 Tax=Salinicola salarius TaxID=430457 RepID=UPI001FC918E7|nr:flagellar basal body-associated protein FliL [Salinicola salarius]MDF3917575.1 flagellar basal body-associated protein FliL [Salinicola salarius]
MAASRKSRSLLLIGLLIVLLAVTSSVAVYFFLDARDGSEATKVVNDEPVEAPVPIFVTINPFTVNLQSDYGDRLLYVGLSLRVGDEATSTFLTQNMPEVRSRLLMLLSGKSAEELIKPEGKVQLKQQILDLFNEPITTPQPTLSIDDVLFSDFIVQ